MRAVRPTLLFVHGWAFDASVWDRLRAELTDWPQAVTDAGYFGEPMRPPLAGPVVAIGHSLGAMRLMCEPPAMCVGMIFINGFSRFAAAPDFPQGVPGRLLDRMLRRLQRETTALVNDFRRRCGASPTGAPPSYDRLLGGLRELKERDGRAALRAIAQPVLALAGKRDPIVSNAMSAAAFDGRPVIWCKNGGHLLPLVEPAWCGAQIGAFLRSLAPVSVEPA
jgi:pimeloyl-[acyl-carrier protein] methyl ester esterase